MVEYMNKRINFILKADNLDRILHTFLSQQKVQINHLACFGKKCDVKDSTHLIGTKK